MSQLKKLHCTLIRHLFAYYQIPKYTAENCLARYSYETWEIVTSTSLQPTFEGVLTLEENYALAEGKIDEKTLCMAAIVGELYFRQQKEGSVYFHHHSFKKNIKKWLKTLESFDASSDLDILYEQALAQVVSDKRILLLNGSKDSKTQICLLDSREMELACADAIAEKLDIASKYTSDDILFSLHNIGSSFLTVEQQSVIEMALTHRFSIVIGKPGTGKTTVLNQLMKTIKYLDVDAKFALCAPTGKAANRMTQATGQEAQTIHHLLRMNINQVEMPKKINNLDYVIVDEVSMLNLDIFHKLIMSLSAETTILMLGDTNQLPSIGGGMILDDCVNSQRVPVVRLTQVHRQAGDSGILSFAEHIRGDVNDDANDINFFKDILPYATDTSLVEADDSNYLDQMKQAVNKTLVKGFSTKDIQVLTATNEEKNALNQELRPLFNPQENADHTAPFWIGDRVIQLKNDYITGMTNGEVGIVAALNDEVVSVVFPASRPEKIAKKVDYVLAVPEDECSIALAYAITVHKSQGSEFPAVVLRLGRKDSEWVQKNLLYTAATRAKKELILVSTQNQIESCMGNLVKRNTGLKRLLEDKLPTYAFLSTIKSPEESMPVPEPQEETFEQFSFDGF